MIVNASSPETVDLLGRAAQVFRGAEKGVRAFALAENALAFIAWRATSSSVGAGATSSVVPMARPWLTSTSWRSRKATGDAASARTSCVPSHVTARGASKMFLTTGEANRPARALYDALGGGLAEQGPTVNYWFLLPLK